MQNLEIVPFLGGQKCGVGTDSRGGDRQVNPISKEGAALFCQNF